MSALHERCLALLADRATRDLDDAGRRELDAILREHPEWDDDGFDLAAAALDLALHPTISSMPESVRQRLANLARSWPTDPGARGA